MSVWNVIYRAAIGILIVLALAGVSIAYYKPLREHRNLTARKDQLEKDLQARQTRLDELKQKQERLQTDARFVEKMAREDLGLAKPGETVFKFDGDSTVPSRPR